MAHKDSRKPDTGLATFQQVNAQKRLPLPRRLRILVENPDNVLEVPLKRQLVIGRSGGRNAVDIDLARYEGHEKGVSRQHARFEVGAGRIMVRDTRSANGTRLNGKKLTPDHVYELRDGDVVQLGMMLVRVFFIETTTTNPPSRH